MNGLKTCPFCAEEIKEAAIVCKHCGRELPKLHVQEINSPKVILEKIKKSEIRVILKMIGKYFLFEGRANRGEFLIALFVPFILFEFVLPVWLYEIGYLVVLWVSAAGAVRRARDCGISFWLLFIPVINFFIFFALLFKEGTGDEFVEQKHKITEYECTDCGKTVDINDDFCKGCGEKFTEQKKSEDEPIPEEDWLEDW